MLVFVIVNFTGQHDRAMGCPDVVLGCACGVFLHELAFGPLDSVKQTALHNVGGQHPTIQALIEQKVRKNLLLLPDHRRVRTSFGWMKTRIYSISSPESPAG